MTSWRRRWRLACGLAAILAASHAEGQEPATPAGPAWSGSAVANGYLLPDDRDYVNPILVARRARLQLAARYNYEDQDTTSVFAGWIFEGGRTVELGATPMLGVLAGRTDGVAPGCELSLSWRGLSLYSELEYVIDLSDSDGTFYYNWSELAYEPLDGFSIGIAAQRTRARNTDLELERGLLVGFGRGRYSATGYWFNPGSDDRYGILSFGVEY